MYYNLPYFQDPESLSRARGSLIFLATLLSPSNALVEDFAPFENEYPKIGVDMDDIESTYFPKKLTLLLVTGPKFQRYIKDASTLAQNLELAAPVKTDLELIFFKPFQYS